MRYCDGGIVNTSVAEGPRPNTSGGRSALVSLVLLVLEGEGGKRRKPSNVVDWLAVTKEALVEETMLMMESLEGWIFGGALGSVSGWDDGEERNGMVSGGTEGGRMERSEEHVSWREGRRADEGGLRWRYKFKRRRT